MLKTPTKIRMGNNFTVKLQQWVAAGYFESIVSFRYLNLNMSKGEKLGRYPICQVTVYTQVTQEQKIIICFYLSAMGKFYTDMFAETLGHSTQLFTVDCTIQRQ